MIHLLLLWRLALFGLGPKPEPRHFAVPSVYWDSVDVGGESTADRRLGRRWDMIFEVAGWILGLCIILW
jgi:hypothetical protein